jgi:FkbM family methyltransferase
MPLSHNLPLMVAQKPLYDSLLKRLVQHLRQRDGSVSLVDVGANIGDTVIACNLEPGDTALCIEPNAEYWPYLQRNLQLSRGHCLSVQSLVGRTDGALTLTALTSQGTARYITGKTGESVQIRTIPTLMTSASMDKCNLLKIDTDGHDFECLRGAETLLKQSLPVVLFEADIFNNASYGEDLFGVVSMLVAMRYTLFIFYTNDGYFFCFHTRDTIQELYKAAFYQTISTNFYFDVLALPDHAFLWSELEYFAKLTKDPSRNRAAHTIAHALSQTSVS